MKAPAASSRPATIAEVAERYRVSEMHVRRLVDRGVLRPYARLGRVLRFDLAEVDRALKGD